MNGTCPIAAAGMALAFAGLLHAGPATQPAETAPKRPDYVRGLIDEYFQGGERDRFFASAGVDGEITQEEFHATPPAGAPFAQPYDHWTVVAAFDRDGNGKLNWVEAESYRLALQMQVMKLFDTNRDRKLSGAEREAANAHLAAKVRLLRPASGPAAPPPAPAASTWPQQWPQVRDEQDGDRDGALSDQEHERLVARIRAERRQAQLRTYDADRNGKLDAEEQAAAELELRKEGQQWRQQWELSLWDANGDGELSGPERIAMNEHLRRERERAQQRHAEWVRRWDRNADGRLSAAELTEANRLMQETADRRRKEMDADNDGKLTAEEIRAWRDRLFEQRQRPTAPDAPKE